MDLLQPFFIILYCFQRTQNCLERFPMRKKICFIILFVLVGSIHQAQEKPGNSYTLDSAIAMAIQRNPSFKAAQLDVSSANMDIIKGRIKKYVPGLTANMDFGLVPGARGDIFNSPDKQTDLDDLGLFYKFDLALTLPLFTFGRISSTLDAAKHNLGIEESRRDFAQAELSYRVVQAYWGLSSALKTESLAKSSMESFEELLSEIQKRLENEDSEIDDSDYLEAKSYWIDIESIKQESIRQKSLAQYTFNALLDRNPNDQIVIANETAPQLKLEENVQEKLIQMAYRYRPEIQGLNSGLNAILAKKRITQSKRLPAFFIAAGLSYAHAGNRQDQTNPFAVDNFNYRYFGAQFGFKWSPDILFHNAEIKKNQYQYQAVQEKMRALKAKIGLETNQAYLEVKRNHALLLAAKESLGAAKTWLRISLDNWNMGLGEAYRLLRAYQAYYRLRGTEIEREYEYNVSLAKMAYTLGDIDLYLEWMRYGEVTFE